MTRILLIDDDAEVRGMLARTLTHFGHVVIQACNGKEGLSLFQASRVDIVITDIVMPEMEGFEVLRELRKIQSNVVIIAMSGGGRQDPKDVLHIAKHLGAARVLSKPFLSDELISIIDDLVLKDANRPTGSTKPD
jgi:two-component system response regulator (stage 0 sporulation protein F)